MSNTVVGPRKVRVDGTEFTLASVEDGTEGDFISAYRVYDFTNYTVDESGPGVTVTWDMGDGSTYTVNYQ